MLLYSFLDHAQGPSHPTSEKWDALCRVPWAISARNQAHLRVEPRLPCLAMLLMSIPTPYDWQLSLMPGGWVTSEDSHIFCELLLLSYESLMSLHAKPRLKSSRHLLKFGWYLSQCKSPDTLTDTCLEIFKTNAFTFNFLLSAALAESLSLLLCSILPF